jgi:hypothetical protein
LLATGVLGGCNALVRLFGEQPSSWLPTERVPVRAEPPPPASPPDRRLAEVVLVPPDVSKSFRWEAERLGLLTMLVESGLSDLPGVVPMVGDEPVSPGIADRLTVGVETWNATLNARMHAGRLEVELEICPPAGACVRKEAAGTPESPFEAVASVLAGAADTLGRSPLPGSVAAWGRPISKDPYAILLCGRSAATWYGMLPAPSLALLEDRKRDAVTRAVFLDPSMPPALWVEGRRRAGLGEDRRALISFTRAGLERPDTAIYLADQAAMLMRVDQADAAWTVWEAADAIEPWDPRFALARARCSVASGHASLGKRILDGLSARFQDDSSVAELRVAIADATGDRGNLDALLRHWQAVAPFDPEPVRRRIGLEVKAGRLAEALKLTDILRERGSVEEASRMALGLAAGLREWDRAIGEAVSLGEHDLSLRLRARQALDISPEVVPEVLADDNDPEACEVRGEVRLAAGDAAGAVVEADCVLAQVPWDADALGLRAQALCALGAADAGKAFEKWRFVDPDAARIRREADVGGSDCGKE